MHGDQAAVCDAPLRQFGGVHAFGGEIATVRATEDNVLVKQRVSEPGGGRVLVVDGGASRRCALLGDNIASAALAGLALGVTALGTNPRASGKAGTGEIDVPVTFGGVTFRPGSMIASDEDGVVVIDAAAA